MKVMNWLMCVGDSVAGPVGWLWEKRFNTWFKYENYAGKEAIEGSPFHSTFLKMTLTLLWSE